LPQTGTPGLDGPDDWPALVRSYFTPLTRFFSHILAIALSECSLCEWIGKSELSYKYYRLNIQDESVVNIVVVRRAVESQDNGHFAE